MRGPSGRADERPEQGSRPAGQVSVDAPAKINLCLEILGRRADGYHEIDTVMQTVSLADTLTFRARADDGFDLLLRGRADGVPTDGANLALRAAHALVQEVRSRGHRPASLGADIEIEKRIPPGAGLGGGSSDAAATLVGLCRLWGLAIPEPRLREIGAVIGSDIPFLVTCGAARCRGRGERVEPIPAMGELHAVLVPGEPLSTGNIYKEFDKEDLTGNHASCTLSRLGGSPLRLDQLGDARLWNALEAAACRVRPSLVRVKELLLRAGAVQACLSGSGSCVFGLVESEERGNRVAAELTAGGHEAVVVRSVGPR